jgi:hypothetical protein
LEYAADTYLVKMLAAPLGCVLACVTIKDCEEALAADVVKISDERMSIFHHASSPSVFGYTDLIG